MTNDRPLADGATGLAAIQLLPQEVNNLTLLGLIAVAALVASSVLAGVALGRGSWQLMWAAGLLSLAFSLVTGLSIGGFVFLLTTLQFMAAIALRWSANRLGWVGLMALGSIIWVVLVPVQVYFGVVWLPWLLAFPLVMLLCTLALFFRGPLRHREV
ncbi:MAG: hypothetical protein M1319_06350 [Chloroflexi bacterium]|nr:hypothetical protein [Chloroflexota bacterium]